MSENYSFEFSGTKEMFLNFLNQFPNNDNRFYYFDDYIIEISENEIRFGIARGGHSGGYWFIPTITEYNNKTSFCGKIQYINRYTNKKDTKKPINKILDFLLLVLLLPIILPIFLIVIVYLFLSRIIRKIFKHIDPKEESLENRLYDLMENHLNCIRK